MARTPGTNSRTADKFVIRLPDGMRGGITNLAAVRQRSMNEEIIHGLQWWMERQDVYDQMILAMDKELKRLQAAETPGNGEINMAYLDAMAEKYPEVATLISLIQQRLSN